MSPSGRSVVYILDPPFKKFARFWMCILLYTTLMLSGFHLNNPSVYQVVATAFQMVRSFHHRLRLPAMNYVNLRKRGRGVLGARVLDKLWKCRIFFPRWLTTWTTCVHDDDDMKTLYQIQWNSPNPSCYTSKRLHQAADNDIAICAERERSSLTASLQVLHTDLSQLTFGVPIKVMSVEDGIREKGLVGGVKALNALGPLCLWQCVL